MYFGNTIKVSNFDKDTEIVNGIYHLVETKDKDFGEKRSLYEKDGVKLSLWYDFNGKFCGGRFYDSENLIKTYAWYDRGEWNDSEKKWNGYWYDIRLMIRRYDILIEDAVS